MSLNVQIGVACGAALLGTGLVLWGVLRARSTPEKRERNRRLALQASGRLGDAMLTEVQDDTIYYTYTLRGVQYEASQDISSLRDRLPADPERLIGMVGLKYAAKNPANSILICEEWSGLRAPPSAKAIVRDEATAPSESANTNGVRH